MPTKTLTYETRLALSPEQDAALCQYAELWNQVKFQWFANLQKPKAQQQGRTEFLNGLGMPFSYRVFQGVRQSVKGLMKSHKTNRDNRIVNLEVSLKQQKKRLDKLINRYQSVNRSGCPRQAKKLKAALIQKQQKLSRLEKKFTQLNTEKKLNHTPICFGGRKLLKERSQLSAPGEIQDWQQRWQAARCREFLLVGSHDESWGCQNAQLSPTPEEGAYQLKLLIPHRLRDTLGNLLLIDGIRFRYGQEFIAKALLRNKLSKVDDDIKGQALSYRFKRDEKGWRLLVSLEVSGPEKASDWIGDDHGVISVDINPDHLAVVEVDRKGNPQQHRTFQLPLHFKNKDQRAAIIGDAVKDLMDFATKQQKSIVIEKLDFQQKKRAYQKQDNPRYARMLNAFAYGKIKEVIETQCLKRGIELDSVNPAWTSQLGKLKYQDKHGLSVHHAAAVVIGRRHYGYQEKPPKRLTGIDTKGMVKVVSPPVRMAHTDFGYYKELLGWYRPLAKTLDFTGGWRHIRCANRVRDFVSSNTDERPVNAGSICEEASAFSTHPAL